MTCHVCHSIYNMWKIRLLSATHHNVSFKNIYLRLFSHLNVISADLRRFPRRGMKYFSSKGSLSWRRAYVMPLIIFMFTVDIMTYQYVNATLHQLCTLCFSIVAHLVSKPTSYPLNRATSDSTPKRGQVCQQLIHHAQYQLISKHKQSIFDIRDSWIRGGTAEEMHL